MSGFNINTFKQRGLRFGGARPALFNIRISNPPPGVGIGTTKEDLEFLAHSASLPGSTINEVEVPYFGRKIKVNGDRVFDNWTISIMNDETFNIRGMFENWHNKMNTLVSNRMSDDIFPLAYKVDAEVRQFGKPGPGEDGGIIRAYRMEGCFPTSIEPIPLDWNQTNAIETFTVTFAYDLWTPLVHGGGEVYNPVLNPA